ncbi:hypothetical protein Anapl_00869 [Anas platyrhynchos]|uniref:Uncharacterized protein n=1 Tax=Anas platyrhynchos TaxID=8839 RepID=R0JZK5_ANAPL|nr:hypothetical protein Anapl_00869 [Anas platyrhynchos]
MADKLNRNNERFFADLELSLRPTKKVEFASTYTEKKEEKQKRKKRKETGASSSLIAEKQSSLCSGSSLMVCAAGAAELMRSGADLLKFVAQYVHVSVMQRHELPLMAFSENSMQLETVLELEGLCLSLGSEELNPEEREMSCYVTCNTLAAALYIPYPGALTKVI